jgi:hypothetical protein
VSARVLMSDEGGVERVELVAGPEAAADAVVADAVRRLADKFSLTLSPAMFAVSGLPSAEAETAPATEGRGAGVRSADERVRIGDINVSAGDGTAKVHVTLLWDGQTWDGVHEGPNTSTRRYRLLSDATLSGIGQILGDTTLFSLEDLQLVSTLDGPVVVVVIELTGKMIGKRLTGSCSAAQAHGSMDEAVVCATLQAVNRLFARFAGTPLAH